MDVDYDRLQAPTHLDIDTFIMSSRLENVLFCFTKRQIIQWRRYA